MNSKKKIERISLCCAAQGETPAMRVAHHVVKSAAALRNPLNGHEIPRQWPAESAGAAIPDDGAEMVVQRNNQKPEGGREWMNSRKSYGPRSDMIIKTRKTDDKLMDELVAMQKERDQLHEQLEHAQNPAHTCHDKCQRPACVMRRERDQIKAVLQQWNDWYRDSESVGGPIHATRELLSK